MRGEARGAGDVATRGKTISVLNPAEPPLIMRDTVYCRCDDADRDAITKSIEAMVAEVQTYVPGYRLKQAVQFESIGSNAPLRIPEMGGSFTGLKVSVFLEVEGAAHYLPAYAGNREKNGRASGRERVGQYGKISVVAG